MRTPLNPTRETLYSNETPAVAIRLFFCGVPIPEAEASGLLASGLAEQLYDAGILVYSPPGVWTFPFHLRIVRGLYLFSDYLGEEGGSVIGAAETTAILYQASHPSRTVESSLDLDCGAGTLAVLLARAVALATFNAAINGIDNTNAKFRVSDLFDVVSGERFDLIVSHPPYYPVGVGALHGEAQTFLRGGLRGDELAAAIVEAIPRHLRPSGRGIVFTSWPDGRYLPPPAGYRVLELTAGRREIAWCPAKPADHSAYRRRGRLVCRLFRSRGLLGQRAFLPNRPDDRGGKYDPRARSAVARSLAQDAARSGPLRGRSTIISALPNRIADSIRSDRRSNLEEVRASLRRGLLIIDACPT